MSREEFLNQESAGGLANFVLTVDQAWFAIDPVYSEKAGGDTYFLHWAGRTDLADRPLMGAEDFHPKWTLDPDFVSVDGGKTVVSQSGRKQKVGKAYARMCKEAAKATAHLEGTPEDFLASADPKDASIWVGTQWRMDMVTPEGNWENKRDELMPVEYIGRVQVGAPVSGISGISTPVAAAPQAVPTAPQAAPVAPLAAAPAPAQANGARAQVEALAASAADYRTFQTTALTIAGVAEDSELVQDILNPQGLYARIHG